LESPDLIIDQFHHLEHAVSTMVSGTSLPLAESVVTTGVDISNESLEEATESVLSILGNDLLIFLCATIGIVPLFKVLKASPVIGFLTAGLIMGPAGFGVFSDLDDMETLADAGVLFLLFEQGLELTVDRLKSLSKYAFGMGTLQVLLSTLAFCAFPFLGGVFFLEKIVGSPADVVDITRFDEAIVVGMALSLSSSAFVLKIMQERGQLATKSGSAALGILLLQDIAVVPLLVLLPIIESSKGSLPMAEQAALLGATFLKAIVGLGGILVVGGQVTKFLFALVAQTKSSETFVALVLLVALGTGALTDYIGLSSTLGAFTAGTLLAESNYRTQIESDIKPFRGLLLGLFFLTTGASVDPIVIREQFGTVLALLAGLVAFKAVITTSLGPLFGLSKSESIITGLLLSGGGEFAFVVLTLADRLDVIPDKLAKVLVGVVVLSMALTPYLGMLGERIAEYIENQEREEMIERLALEGGGGRNEGVSESESESSVDLLGGNGENSVAGSEIVICGFNQVGQMVASFIQRSELDGKEQGADNVMRYVAFDLDPRVVIDSYRDGKRVLYGDGTVPQVLETAGITDPKLFIITYDNNEAVLHSVERLRQSFPNVPIYARASEAAYSNSLLEAGATRVLCDEVEASLRFTRDVMSEFQLPLPMAVVPGVQIERAVGAYMRDSRADLEREQRANFDAYQADKYLNNNPDTDRPILRDGSPFKRFESILNDGARKARGIIGTISEVADLVEDENNKGKNRSAAANANANAIAIAKASAAAVSDDKGASGSSASSGGNGVLDDERDADLVEGVDICSIPPRDDRRGD
jgi:Kef-type K+ transport system membrane component KefB